MKFLNHGESFLGLIFSLMSWNKCWLVWFGCMSLWWSSLPLAQTQTIGMPTLGCHNTLTPARTPRLGLCHNTETPARTPRLGLSQHTGTNNDTSNNTSKNTKAWAVPQHTDTSKNTKATLKCCYAPHSYLGTSLNHDKLLARKHPPSWNVNMVCGKVIQKFPHMQSSHPMQCTWQCTIVYARCPQSGQLGNKNNT